ncbi:hypothetical protein [Actinomadura meridiana]
MTTTIPDGFPPAQPESGGIVARIDAVDQLAELLGTVPRWADGVYYAAAARGGEVVAVGVLLPAPPAEIEGVAW